jgi:iron complex outermembrane recepter protein
VIYALNRGGNGIVITNGSKYLPFIPPLHTGTDLRANFSRKLTHLRSFYIKMGMEYYSRQNHVYSVNNTETPTPGYILLNAGAGTEITDRNGKVKAEINILCSNIANTAYQSHLSRLKYFEQYPGNSTGRSGIYNMGRNISLKVTFPLNF